MNIIQAKRDFEEKGYAKIEGVFSKDEMHLIRAGAYFCVEHANHLVQRLPNGKPAIFFWPQAISSFCKKFSNDFRLKYIVKEFLGDEVRQLNNQIYFRESGDGDEFGWHQDICFRTPASEFDGIESSYLQTIICVDRIEENGAIEFIPGSHRRGALDLVPRDDSERGLRRFKRGDWQGEKVTAEPGDVLLWSVMVVHGSERNDSGRNRMTYMNGFAKESAILNKERFPIYAV